MCNYNVVRIKLEFRIWDRLAGGMYSTFPLNNKSIVSEIPNIISGIFFIYIRHDLQVFGNLDLRYTTSWTFCLFCKCNHAQILIDSYMQTGPK